MTLYSLIGIGRVGMSLFRSMRESGANVEALFVRANDCRLDTDTIFRSIDDLNSEIDSDVIIITTQDSNITEAAKQLSGRLRPGSVVFHTSGALSSEVLSELRNEKAAVASVHPLTSVSDPETADLSQAFYCIEGDDKAVAAGKDLVKLLGGRSFTIDPKAKPLYHAAAVLSAGGIVSLFDTAVDALSKCGLSTEKSQMILHPLLESVTENLKKQTPKSALTGPFARRDPLTISENVKALKNAGLTDALSIYLLLGRHSLEMTSSSVDTDEIVCRDIIEMELADIK